MHAQATRPALAELAQAFDLTGEELANVAARLADQVQRHAEMWAAMGTPESVARGILRRIALRQRVRVPNRDAFAQQVNRMQDPMWWRRQLRKRFQACELLEIRRGAVHRHASAYVSGKSLRRFEHRRRQLAETLEAFEALNQNTGEVIPLSELIATSQANPVNRRKAMMVRIKGIEQHALNKGHEAHFLTITAPSRMHPMHSTGRANVNHDGTNPRQAQAYLNDVWRKAMRNAQHQGLSIYGLRVVEPHHDACPHWHVLVFTAPEHAAQLLATVRAYALADSPNEPGAALHRFKVEAIDPTKGSAVGYVAKYVSKSIDGEGLDVDSDTECKGDEAARRIVAWSRLWGIRQFQFFGVPAITPTRELFRHDGQGLASRALREAHQATKDNDYAAWLRTCEVYGLRFRVQYRERESTRYAGETARAVQGLSAHAADLPAPVSIETRTETWSIQRRQAQHTDAANRAPWTRINNCAPVDFIEVFGTEHAGHKATRHGPNGEPPGGAPPRGRRRPQRGRSAGDRQLPKHSTPTDFPQGLPC